MTFKTSLRSLAYRVAPDATLTLLSIRSRRLIERQSAALGLVDLARRIATHDGATVQRGPFAGLRLDLDALPVHIAPKLLGTYEDELHEAVEVLIARRPAQVLNVGCAEGYYAIGLARRLPDARVHAFDADPKARAATSRNAALNGVADRVTVHGVLHHDAFESFLRQDTTLVIMDCEGAEADLLDPARVPSLARVDVLVELHPSAVPTHPGHPVGPLSPEP